MTEALNIMRHESVFDPSKFPYTMHIIGAGATGSRVFAALLELGMKNIHVFDGDIVEDHNLANQIYVAEDINQPKVTGCFNFAERKLGSADGLTQMKFMHRKVTKEYIGRGYLTGGIVFLMTDTMESRKDIVDALVARCDAATRSSSDAGMGATPMLIIETRMASTHGNIFSFNPFDVVAREAWYATLVDDTDEDNIELSPCGTTLSVGTTASLIANYAVWQMMQFFIDPLGMQQQVDFFFKPTLTITSPTIATAA